ncbi:MAG: 16S rRNA (guanine(966)-N(2))-methyltransferase RsmD [Acidisphaera sp.]|nr:16S rRNA (guanine(966)-N(2))-methyltransferase RsmD [Acidisphaera sp.]
MRIVGGAWRGRSLAAPAGRATRPTADRVRQALFDMLLHAPWGGRTAVEGARVLDAFAGTGALGLEALSRGAGHATFIECARPALAALRANVAACRASATILAGDALDPPPITPCALVFLDPPYGADLVARCVAALQRVGALAPAALLIAEIGRAEAPPFGPPLAERVHGAARLLVWRSRPIA